MRGRLIDVRSISAADEQRWQALAGRAVEPNPSLEPACVVPAARHQSFGHEIELAVAEEDGKFYACLPVRNVKRWHKLPYPIVTSQVRRMIYSGTPLVDPDRGLDACGALFDVLGAARERGGGRVLALQEITGGGAVDAFVRAAAEQRGLRRIEFESWDRPMLFRRRHCNYDDHHQQRTRRDIAKKSRRLARTIGDPKLVDHGGDPDALDRYIALEAAGYKAGIGVAMATVPGETEWFREMCGRFAEAGRLHVLALEAGGHTLAMNVWIEAGEGLFMIKTSFDEDYSYYSPGLLLHTASLEYFHNSADERWLDTCTYKGNHVLASVFPDRKQIVSHFVVLSSGWDRFADEAVLRSWIGLRPLHTRIYERLHPDERFSRRPRNVSTRPSATARPEPS